MAFSRVRPAPALRVLTVALAVGAWLAPGGVARAGKNDLQLLNLCPPDANGDCSWVKRGAGGEITAPVSLAGDVDAQSRYRSLMSELGVVIAPRLQTPADTLGYAGFQFSFELGLTKINADRSYWNGVQGVNPSNPAASRPDSYLTTIGGFVRKGMWLPLPAFEWGVGAMSLLGSRMYAVQAYAKLALQEGFHGWMLPSLAVRGSASQLLGTSQVDLNVFGVDVLISKAFGIAGTVRLEPFLGWNMLFIDAVSGHLDATPACDAFEVRNAAPTDAPPGPQCRASQNGTWNDQNANFTFPQQDVITRQRWSGGLKMKLAVMFLVAEYAIIPGGSSHDENQPAQARDLSGSQQSFGLSAGLDF
jgi:hypothetical protein